MNRPEKTIYLDEEKRIFLEIGFAFSYGPGSCGGTPFKAYFMRDLMIPGFETEFRFLFFGFRLRWNFKESDEFFARMKKSAEEAVSERTPDRSLSAFEDRKGKAE